MDSVYQHSALGRPVDPSYVTNLAILILSVSAGVLTLLAYLLNGADLLGAGQGAFFAMVNLFFGWMITREIDPDHQATAFVAAGICLGASLYMGASNILVLYGVLVLLRMVNRTVGLPLKTSDSVVVFVGMVIVTLLGYWPVTVVGALAFFLDSQLELPNQKHLIAAMASLSVAVVGAVLGAGLVMPSIEVLVIVAVTSVIYLVVVLTLREVTSPTDVNNGILNTRRIQWAMMIGLLGALAALWNGDSGFVAMAPLWWSLLATGLYGLVLLVLPQRIAQPNVPPAEMIEA